MARQQSNGSSGALKNTGISISVGGSRNGSIGCFLKATNTSATQVLMDPCIDAAGTGFHAIQATTSFVQYTDPVSGSLNASTVAYLFDGNWHGFAVIGRGTTAMDIIIDGVLASSIANPGWQGSVTLGCISLFSTPTSTNICKPNLAICRAYVYFNATQITSSDVISFTAGTLEPTSFTNSCQAYYRMPASESGSTITDSSGNGYDLTVYGTLDAISDPFSGGSNIKRIVDFYSMMRG